jgi:hypothetical protein
MLEELHIGESGDHPVGEQAVELSQGGAQCFDGHVRCPPVPVPYQSMSDEPGPRANSSVENLVHTAFGAR